MENTKKNVLLVGISTMILTFLLLLIGFRFGLNLNIVVKNIIAFTVLSIIYGLTASVLFYLKPRIGLLLFFISYVVGFAVLYKSFFQQMNGFAELAGLVSLLYITFLGIICGFAVQIGIYIYKRIKNKHKQKGDMQ